LEFYFKSFIKRIKFILGRIYNNEPNTTNYKSKNESTDYRDSSPIVTNKTFNNKINSDSISNNNNYNQIKTNLTIINQNCKNPSNNKIVILNTPYIEEKVNNSNNNKIKNNIYDDENLKGNGSSSNKLNIFHNLNKSADVKEKPITLINNRYHSTTPSLKKIEINPDNSYNRNVSLKLISDKQDSFFRTINIDNDQTRNSGKIKSNSQYYNESSKKIYNNYNKNNTNSFITIQDEFEEKSYNDEYLNRIFIASDNPKNLENMSKVNSFKKVLINNSDLKKTKSNSDFDVSKHHNSINNNRISPNPLTENKYLKFNSANKTFTNNFYTIERLSSIENDNFSTNNNTISNQENLKFKLVKRNIKDINNRINDKMARNYSINPTSIFTNSQTINTENHFRSFSEIRPKRESQALNDLTKIIQNKSVEKLTNMKFESLELKNTKEGIDIIDKLINNLTRLKTIMIEEEERNHHEM